MEKMNLTEALLEAKKGRYALGAFNIFNYISAKAVIDAAGEAEKPVLLQTSVSTVKYYGADKLYAMLEELVKTAPVPVYIHLDHCTEPDLAKACADIGWDGVMIDASKLPIEENIRMTKDVADYAHARGVQVEGELGVIKGVEEEIASDVSALASYDDCMYYARESGVDLFAPALGTAHGVYHGTPVIQFDLAKRLAEALDMPVVCHGGTGLTEEVFLRLIRSGVSKVNISTALKHAYIDGAHAYIEASPDEYNPLHFVDSGYQSLKETAAHHIAIFSDGH